MNTVGFGKILKIFEWAKKCLGIADYDNDIWRTRIQRSYLIFLFLNGILCAINSFTSVFVFVGQNKVRAFMVGFQGFCVTILAFFKLIFIRSTKLYGNCLEWCSKWHNQEFDLENEKIKKILEDCSTRSTKLFQRVVVVLSSTVHIAIFFQITFLSVLNGRLISFQQTAVFWSFEGDTFSEIVNIINQTIVGCDNMLVDCLFFGVVFVMIDYFVAIIGTIQTIVRNIQCPVEREYFDKAIKLIVELHCDLIQQQKILVNASAVEILIFEMISFAMALWLWILFLFDNSQYFMIVAASGFIFPFAILCWMNEKLVDEYTSMKETLYEIDWYLLEPKQRRSLQLVMIMVDRPHLLTAGPFHLISFQELSNFMRRVYSSGLLIKKMIQLN